MGSVGSGDTGSIGSDDTGSIGSDDTGSVGSDDIGSVGSDDTGSVGGDDTGSVGSNDTGSVGRDDTGSVGSKLEELDSDVMIPRASPIDSKRLGDSTATEVLDSVCVNASGSSDMAFPTRLTGTKSLTGDPATPPEFTAGSEPCGPVSRSRVGCAQSPGAASDGESAEAAEPARQKQKSTTRAEAIAIFLIAPSRESR
jgi:hypothetical protein